ncbi:hypothetical protein [Brucella rhizosphaerae]|uniref:hypothetical protein n=1 Tax=Brucella rhizosphaerae TaxID=571254 RepID=UPI00360AC0AF
MLGKLYQAWRKAPDKRTAPSVEQMLPQGLKTNPLDYLTDSLLRTDGQGNSEVGQEAQNLAGFQRQISGILGNLLTTGEISDADREWLTNQVATRTGLSQNDAQTRVNQTVERVQALRTDAQKRLKKLKRRLLTYRRKLKKLQKK